MVNCWVMFSSHVLVIHIHVCTYMHVSVCVCGFYAQGLGGGDVGSSRFFLRPQNNIPEKKPKNINTLSCMCVCALLVILLHSLDDEVHLFISVCLYLCMYNFGPLYCKFIAVCNQHLLP